MKPRDENPDVLGRALQKQESGRGTSNTEKRALHDFAAGKIGRDHFAAIATTPVRLPKNSLPDSPPAKAMHQVEGLEAALRNNGNLEDRVAALETLLANYAHTTLSVCIGGSATSKVFLTK